MRDGTFQGLFATANAGFNTSQLSLSHLCLGQRQSLRSLLLDMATPNNKAFLARNECEMAATKQRCVSRVVRHG